MTTPTTVQVKLRLRGDTASGWSSVNPVLLTNELGLETDTKKIKIGNGSTAWNSLAYFPSIVSGGTVLGNLEIGTTGTLTFEGSTANGFETTLGVTDPTADRTITLPDQSGTVLVTGNASIVNADIAADAEIAVSKLANGTANQVLVTDGTDVSWSDDLTLAGNVTLNAQADLRFADSDSSNWVAFQAPATITSNVTWTLPDADGTDGQVLSTNGTGTLSWTTASGGGGGNSLIFSMIF